MYAVNATGKREKERRILRLYVRQEWSRMTRTEAREKEFPWDYAAVFCVLLKDRSCPGVGLPPSDGDDSNQPPPMFLRDVSLSVYRDENTSDMPLRKCPREGVRGANSNFDPLSACSNRSLHSVPFLNKRYERIHLRRIVIVGVDLTRKERLRRNIL